MPDQESEPELGTISASKAPTRLRKRARLASVATDSDSDFIDQEGYTTIRRFQSKASQKGKAPQGTQDIRDALALVPQSSLYE